MERLFTEEEETKIKKILSNGNTVEIKRSKGEVHLVEVRRKKLNNE